VEAKAHEVLARGLEESVRGGRAALVKTLVEGGADATRTEAVHIAIRHGHVSIMAHLVNSARMSVNARDGSGCSPLHAAAAANQPKAAAFLLKHSAFSDALDGEGRTALDIAVALRWKEMQRVLRDPSLLFWNRASRAGKLYKDSEYELACENYEAALAMREQMRPPPAAENMVTLYFNYGRAAQLLGQLSRAISLFSQTLESNPRHERALDHRADCHSGLLDFDSSNADLRQLSDDVGVTADAATRQGWAKRLASNTQQLGAAPHVTLGVARDASDATARKAYHAACLQLHPDKHAASTDDARARAKHRFARV